MLEVLRYVARSRPLTPVGPTPTRDEANGRPSAVGATHKVPTVTLGAGASSAHAAHVPGLGLPAGRREVLGEHACRADMVVDKEHTPIVSRTVATVATTKVMTHAECDEPSDFFSGNTRFLECRMAIFLNEMLSDI